jgi:hypothetical protein
MDTRKLLINFMILLSVFAILSLSVNATNKYWVGGTGNWSQTSHWSATSNGTGGSSIPTASDIVYFDMNSSTGSYTVTQDVTNTESSTIYWSKPPTGAPTFAGSSTLKVYGSWYGVSGMAYTYVGSLTFMDTGLNINLDFVGSTLAGGVTASGTGNISLLNNFVLSGGTFNLGSCAVFKTNGYNFSANNFNPSSVGLLNITNSVITIGGTGTINPTSIDATGSLIKLTGSGKTFTSSRTLNNLLFTGGSSTIFSGTASINNLTISLPASTDYFQFINTVTIRDTLNLTGVSSNNRQFISSATAGTPVTLNVNNIVGQSTDFMDINFNESKDLSAFTGGSGDCGGNGNITFSTPTNQYWYQDTGSWNNESKWFLGTMAQAVLEDFLYVKIQRYSMQIVFQPLAKQYILIIKELEI